MTFTESLEMTTFSIELPAFVDLVRSEMLLCFLVGISKDIGETSKPLAQIGVPIKINSIKKFSTNTLLYFLDNFSINDKTVVCENFIETFIKNSCIK